MAFLRLESKADKDIIHGLTAIAIDGEKNSQSAVKWVADNLVHGKKPPLCILVHVQSKTMQLGENVVSKEGCPASPQEFQQFFLPYRGFCTRKGIEAKEVVLFDIDVPSALVDYIIHNNIHNIVVGASRRNAFIRKFKQSDIPSILLKTAPESCSVYVISKGKVQTSRLASQTNHSPTSSTHQESYAQSTGSANSISSQCSSPQCQALPSPGSITVKNASTARHNNHWEVASPPIESLKSNKSTTPRISFRESWKSEVSGRMSSDQNCEDDKFAFSFNTTSQGTSPTSHSERMLNRDSVSDISEISGPQSFRSTNTSCENLEFSATSESSKGSNSSQLANLLDTEMRKLKLEMQQSMVLFNSVTKEAVLAKHMIRELQQLRTSDVTKTEGEQITEGVEMEKKNNKVALLVQTAQRIAGIEAEKKAQHEAEKKRKTMETMANNAFRCRTYTIDDIEVATNHFELSQKIGEGGYGPVFKGVLNHIDVAIKILRPDLSQGHMQFRQEVDVLSSMRHPHIVILLGACPEYGCLVYEFMENGSLEDRLLRKHKTPPIPWRARFRIAFEIATALHFLHETKPEPLVHRDLKPANILLDYNLVSKISDVGLARLLPASAASKVSQYRMTAAAGTFYYIDPEYQQTGKLSVKSDIYSFGVVLLQLLTAKPPMGLFHHVQEAINNGTFADVLDKTITDWPVKEALSLAKIAVKCCELYKKHRPDLASVVLPELKRLRNFSLGKKAVEHETIIPLPSPTDLVS